MKSLLLFLMLVLVACTPTQEFSRIVELNDGDTYDITAEVITKTINGKKLQMFAYNGMIPGPVLKADRGSKITVNFKNDIPHDTTVHWHGLRHDNKDDGVPGVTQPPVEEGQTYTYTVKFPDSGIFWYHPHIREDLQQDLGLAGNLWVMEDMAPVNKEELLVLDDLLMDDQGIVPYDEEHANHAIMGRFGNVMLVNGEVYYELDVNKDDVVRFYITNVANVRPYNISFGNAKMKLVGSDIGLYEQEQFVDSIVIAPAERYIVDVLFEQDETLNNRNPHATYELGKIKVSGTSSEQDYTAEFKEERTNEKVVDDVDKFRQYFDKEIDYEFELTVDMPMMGMMHMENMPCHQMPDGSWMGNCGDDHDDEHDIEWEDDMQMMNARSTTEEVTWIMKDKETGIENMDFSIKSEIGDVLKIRFFNDPDSMHPMHVHRMLHRMH